MKEVYLLFLLIGVNAIPLGINAYVFQHDLDTKNGFCEGPDYGRIPVGSTGYNDEKCEKYVCEENHLTGEGCGSVRAGDGCWLVRGSGRYPACCPSVRCANTEHSDG
ncbi:toxin-like protein 14 [Stegodyphus dumicola]|uniref:toxin-like protein 14 n=1 Tax=Stegodyphus dumicola TaxID=202533 RepID=UPI0015B13801|nr:toxin-like protein 14 [Stegodyphus dumicola]